MGLTEWLGIINITVLTITLIVVWFYTYYTKKMQETMSRQLSHQVKPLIAIKILEGGRLVELRNIGNGTALNIKILRIKLREDSDIYFDFPMVLYLLSGEVQKVETINFVGDEEWSSDFNFAAHLDKRYANKVIPIEISYWDVERNEHRQSFDVGLGDTRFN